MQNKTALFAALNTFVTARVLLIEQVIAAGYPTSEAARPAIMEWIGAKTGVAIKVQGSGRVVFDNEAGNAASARNTLRDIMLMLEGQTRREAVKASPAVSRKAAPLTKAQKEAVAALIAAFGGDRKAARSAV
jgi:hypothetical protein